MNTKEKLDALDAIINDAVALYKQVQRQCQHENINIKPDSFKCPYGQNDEYWMRVECLDCRNIRTVDSVIDGQRNEEYYSLARRI